MSLQHLANLIFLYLEMLNEIMLFMKTHNIDTNYKLNINQIRITLDFYILYYLLKHIILILIIAKYKLSNNNTFIFYI